MSRILELPRNPPDLVAAINERLRQISDAVGPAAGGSRSVYYGTRADRVGRPVPSWGDGSEFVETDTGWVYQARVIRWAYLRGEYSRTQSQLAALAATLGDDDVGALVWVSDYAHRLRWTGTAWEFAPGDGPGAYIAAFLVDPNPTTGWQLCDGTATTYLKADGTTGSYTTPNVSGSGQNSYLKLSDTVGGPNAATGPTLSVTTATAVAAAGTTFLTTAAALNDGQMRNITARAWFRR